MGRLARYIAIAGAIGAMGIVIALAMRSERRLERLERALGQHLRQHEQELARQRAAEAEETELSHRMYFPDRIFHKDPEHNELVAGWYSKHLRAMREPSLWTLSQKDPTAVTFRLLWLPSFDHPVVARIEVGERVILNATYLDGQGGYEPGRLIDRRSVVLEPWEWKAVLRLMDSAQFWQMPSRQDDEGTLDGDQLILEAVVAGKYHLVDRNYPISREYEAVCQKILDLTGLNLKEAWNNYHHE